MAEEKMKCGRTDCVAYDTGTDNNCVTLTDVDFGACGCPFFRPKMRYQVMPGLSDAEYEKLRGDIAEHGVMTPIVIDENGNILDGYHRKQICDELGITDYPTITKAGMSEDEKMSYAMRVNVVRRHLSGEQLVKLAKDAITRQPELRKYSDEKIASLTGILRTYVSEALRELTKDRRAGSGESGGADASPEAGDVPEKEEGYRMGADGRMHPAGPAQIKKNHDRIIEAVKADPEASADRISKDLGLSYKTVKKIKDEIDAGIEPDELAPDGYADEEWTEVRPSAGKKREAWAAQGIEDAAGIEEKYDVIVIDPEWPGKPYDSRLSEAQYGTDTGCAWVMKTADDLKAMKLPAAEDCLVFLWTRAEYLPKAFETFEAWGVRYETVLVWAKDFGLETWGAPEENGELCLVGALGKAQLKKNTKGFKMVTQVNTPRYGGKPKEIYAGIEKVTEGERIAMWGRRNISGFDSWGRVPAPEGNGPDTDAKAAECDRKGQSGKEDVA